MTIFNEFAQWYYAHLNYGTVTLFMGIESTFIPFPSEIIVPPAAYKAAQGELNIYLVVFFATLGALLGSLFNYFLALTVGRKVIYALADTRLAKLFMIEPKSVTKAEDYFVKHGNISTFIGRLVPAVRHLISIPAGLARMPLKNFILFTSLGAGMWNIILAAIGYYIPKDKVNQYFEPLSHIMWALGGLLVLYLLYSAFIKKKKETVA